MGRRERITRFITPQQKGIEIGPYFQPLAPKREGYNCLVVDVFDAATLRQRALDDPQLQNQVIDNIEEVDLRGSSSAIAEMVEQDQLGTFDYIISSHNFEHLPDPIRFLKGCNKVLRPGGMLSMAIPDRRVCFDHFRPHSTLAELLEANFAARKRPTPTQVFEGLSLSCKYGPQQRDGFSLSDDPAEIVPNTWLGDAFRNWESLNQDGLYHDVHCWAFTPASFELIIRDLIFSKSTCWSVLEISKTTGNEFYAHLRNRFESEADPMPVARFYEQRREILYRVNDELGEYCRRNYQYEERLREMLARNLELMASLEIMQQSTSWRITAPLRNASALIRRQVGRLRRPVVNRRGVRPDP